MGKAKVMCGDLLCLDAKEADMLRKDVFNTLDVIRRKIDHMSKLDAKKEAEERADLARDIALLWRRAVDLGELIDYGYEESPF